MKKILKYIFIGIILLFGSFSANNSFATSEFIFEIDTRNVISGDSSNSAVNSFKFPGIGIYNIDWGDGTIETNINGTRTKPGGYAMPGKYTIKISGNLQRVLFNNTGDRNKILDIKQWGNINWTSFQGAFFGAENLNISATDAPNLIGVTSLYEMFRNATSFNSNINHWNVSNVTNMYNLFSGATNYNQPLNDWNVSNVTNMQNMFRGVIYFNQPLNNWNVSNVTNMHGTFYGATNFNQNINSWNIGKVNTINAMFAYTENFNQPLNNWNVANVTNIQSTFYGATNFNQDLSNWNVSNVTIMQTVFWLASSFNQDLSNWNIQNVTNATNIFSNSNLSQENYDKILNAWGPKGRNGVISLGANNTNYCDGEIGRNALVAKGWVITDAGKNCDTNLLNGKQEVTLKQLDLTTNIADGTDKNYTIELSDKFGNRIIPFNISSISANRTVRFEKVTDNSLYINQLLRNGGTGIFVVPPTGTEYSFQIGNNRNYTTPNQNSTNGIYIFRYRGYTPTKHYADIGADPDAEFKITSIRSLVTDNIGGTNLNIGIANGLTEGRFKPLYTTKIEGSILSSGIVEGAAQQSKVAKQKDLTSTRVEGTTLGTIINPTFILRYAIQDKGPLKEDKTNSFKMLIGATNEPTTEITGGEIASNVFDITTDFYTRLVQRTTDLLQAYNAAFSTHISYSLDGKNIVYNGDALGKTLNNYYGEITGTIGAQQSGIKVIGNVSGENSSTDILEGQELQIVGNITKSTVRDDILKTATELTRSIANNTNSNPTSNVSTATGIIYVGGNNGNYVNVSTTTVRGLKTLVVKGRNVYISGNITNHTTGNNLLGIIAMQDENGNGGNIYINPNVRNIDAIMFAEKAILNSLNGSVELGAEAELAILKDQLRIFGTVFSENTVGGSRKTPFECPFYIQNANCNLETSQKYDLNYLRRFAIKSDGTIINGGTPSANNGGATNPLIIEYNPAIATYKLPVFSR